MSKNVAVFVDVANLYYSARGQDVDVDYVALLKAATKGRDLIRAYAYSGLDPENENQRKFIDFLGKNGYKVITKDIRKFGDGRVKANLDIELVVDLFRLAKRMDIAVVVSGDGDFAPAIRALQDEGVRCEVISFRPNTSSDLIAVADEFIDIMKVIGIGRGKKDEEKAATRGMSAPQMPAKEVVPEFGFREASPGVAAAALAALREGKAPATGSSGRGRGRGRSRAAAPAQAEATAAPTEDAIAPPTSEAVEAVETAESAEGEPRRRRRRRGGRGRGRGRGQAEATVPAHATADVPGDGEIGWVELDDISQVGDLDGSPVAAAFGEAEFGEEREYTFEEADAETLAELGLSAQPAPAEGALGAEGQGAVPAPITGRRTRTPRAAAPSGEAVDAAKPTTTRQRRGRAAAAGAGATESPAEAGTDAPSGRSRAARPARATTAGKAPARTGAAAQGDEPKKPRARGSRSTGTSRATRAKTSPSGDAAAAAETSAEQGGTAEGDSTQGIWQRFRGGRTRSS